jgi:hypothetical protein
MSKSGMLAAVALAAGVAAENQGTFVLTAAVIKEHFSAVAAELVQEGAVAEQARIAGIEAAAMPGHEALIKAHKADATKTPADAALAVINAENANRAAMMNALVDDEKKLKGLKSVQPQKEEAENETVIPHDLATQAKAYVAEQAKLGRSVDAVAAVKFIQQQKGA